MRINTTFLFAAAAMALLVGPATAQSRSKPIYKHQPTVGSPGQYSGFQGTPDRSHRDPTGILRGQGRSTLYGGMGNMGGGRGLSANTGIGLGNHGASQGLRF